MTLAFSLKSKRALKNLLKLKMTSYLMENKFWKIAKLGFYYGHVSKFPFAIFQFVSLVAYNGNFKMGLTL